MGRWILLLLAGVSLAACLGPGPSTPPELDLQHWIGQPVSGLIATWGEPNQVEDLGAGKTRYSWLATAYGERSLAANRSPTGRGDDREALAQLRCRARVETDAGGVVTSAEWVGEECQNR